MSTVPTIEQLAKMNDLADKGDWVADEVENFVASTHAPEDHGSFILAPGGEVVAQRVMAHNAAFILACLAYVRAQLGSQGRPKLSVHRPAQQSPAAP